MDSATRGLVLGALLAIGCGTRPGTSEVEVGENASVVSVSAVDVAGAYNTRKVSGLRTRDGRHVRPGVLFRSGHLANVDEQGYAEIVKLGIVSIIDVRSTAEATATPDAPWLVSGTRYMVADLPRPQPPGQVSTLNAVEPKLAAIFAHLGAPGALPAVVHCVLGHDRTCVTMGLVLLSLGVPSEEVAADFATNQASRVNPHGLDDVFVRVAKEGGIDQYLALHSVVRTDVESLRAQALE
jgi:hypothetical protein